MLDEGHDTFHLMEDWVMRLVYRVSPVDITCKDSRTFGHSLQKPQSMMQGWQGLQAFCIKAKITAIASLKTSSILVFRRASWL